MVESFVYCWTDHKTNKIYIGSHKGSLDDGYICSSKLLLQEYKNRPNDFTRQIIAEGKTEDIRVLEYKILTAAKASVDESYYNLHDGFGSYLTEDIKKKIGKKSKDNWQKEEYRDKVSKSHKDRWKYMSDQERQTISQKLSVSNSRPKTEKEKNAMRGPRPHVNQALSKNNNAKKIKTPFGIFDSIKEASLILNMKYDNLWYKLRAKHSGWEYVV